MASDQEQILCSTYDNSYYKIFQNPRQVVQEPAVTMKAGFEWDDEDHPSSLAQKTTPAPDEPQTLPELLNRLHLCVSIRKIVQEEVRRICRFEMDRSLIKATEEALSYAIKSDYDEANDGFELPCFTLWRL